MAAQPSRLWLSAMLIKASTKPATAKPIRTKFTT
jgi:hypothetical protein